jgi:hypothetical protein
MKKLNCRELGGPSLCDEEITGDSFEEIGSNCKTHVMEKISNGDKEHMEAASKMKNATPEEQNTMMGEYKKKYEEASEE